MKLKYIKKPRPAQEELTALTSGGAFKWLAIGQVVEVPEEIGHEIMAKWPGCLELVKTKPKGRPPGAKNKMTSSPQNKAASPDPSDVVI
jgi:hypothetical protein